MPPCAFKSGPYYKGRGSLKLLPALLPILKPAVLDLQPGSCYTFWSIIQTLSPAPAYKKQSVLGNTALKGSTIRYNPIQESHVIVYLRSSDQKSKTMVYATFSHRTEVREHSIWEDAVLLLWSWLRGLGQDHKQGCENLRRDLQRPGRGCGKSWPRFMHSCVTNGMNLHFLDHAQPGSQDS